MASSQFIYPLDIGNEHYRYRKVTIEIWASKLKLEKFDSVKKAIEESSDGLKAAYDAAEGIVDGITKASKKSIEKIHEIREGKHSELVSTIVLPLPNEFNEGQNHNWGEETGVLSRLASGITDTTDKVFGELADQAHIRKPMINPAYFQNYSGSGLRDFSLSFDLIPNNSDEAIVITDIIKTIKKYSSPGLAYANSVMIAPNYFKLKFNNEFIDLLVNAKDVVLKNIDVTYGAEGKMEMFHDGRPKHIKMSLTFGERRLKTQVEWA